MMARYNKKQKSTPLAGSSGENSLNQNPSFPLANNTLVSKSTYSLIFSIPNLFHLKSVKS